METSARLEAATGSGLILPEIIDVPQLAVVLHRTEGCVRALLRRGILPGVKLGRGWVITRRELLRALTPQSVTRRLEVLP
jgi:hypothetical protein